MQKPSKLSDAAVIIIISGDPGNEYVLLTERAKGLREHAGEVAFPGGKQEPQDADLYQTALRECYEEVGVSSTLLSKHAELAPHYTRQGTMVTPFVAKALDKPSLDLNPGEIASAFWVPLSLFRNDERACTHVFKVNKQEYWAPVYHYERYEIWGLTARVLVSFLNQCYHTKLARAHSSAPEVAYG